MSLSFTLIGASLKPWWPRSKARDTCSVTVVDVDEIPVVELRVQRFVATENPIEHNLRAVEF